ncbi:protease pro-enzyme activation domain-containing protein [Granulicella aggregans]|uniref:protease pro-enzyme activation domain-containing protein n=1 Tax=Granulicella aggregans TaxID=474949 RepID=UPI0021DF5B26|nr:protease pro-enzyme activation domain-containing protein [Granulicella aggregans]
MNFVPVRVRSLRLSLIAVLLAASTLAPSNALFAQNDRAASVVHDRVRGPVTNERTALKGQTRPMGRGAVDLGEVPASMSTGRMVLWLRRSAEQQAQLSQFLSHAQDPAAAGYRHWMTPASYGATYGISDNDLAAVQQWLQASGLKVEKVSSARNAILFSGTAGSLASAFHTSIHSYSVGQQKHYSNATDPEVPAALAPVIAGVSPMNDFHARPMHVLGAPARYDAASGRLQPEITVPEANGNALFVTPADASIIYDTPNKNFNPAATQTFDGTGVTIGILGYSALAVADVQNYRTAFLPAGAASNLPQQILDGGIDPGVLYGNNAVEALLDVEIAGGLAPGAAIRYYYAASDDLSDGLILAGLHALEENRVNILSASYGTCERDLGPGGNLAWAELWQQAAAQGITVTVSTGDSGSASCDGDTPDKPALATQGLSVSGLASTPYNIAVGGTDFYQLPGNFKTYVNPASTGQYPYYATALSYIPENPWNDSSSVVGYGIGQNEPVGMGINFTNIIAAGGGLSSVAVCPGTIDDQGGCSQSLTGYAQPAFQLGAGGAFQQTGVRSIPDVSLLSSNGFYGATWAFCDDSITDGIGGNAVHCQVDSNGHLIDGQNVGGVGGTSASTPAFAGMLAVISQSQGGARLGQANTVLYNLAQDYNPDPSSPGKYQQAFHDVAIGNNSVSCADGSQDCTTFPPSCDGCNSVNFLSGYGAHPYYDMASGLGSVDLSQLINLWGATGFASTSNTLVAGTASGALSTAPISVVHGTPLYFTTTVTPSGATGQFSLLSTNNTSAASFSDTGVLQSDSTGNLVTNDLPGGTYTAYAYYSGDTTHTGSKSSNSISVTVSAEPSTTQLFFGGYDPITFVTTEGVSTMPYGIGSYISAQPYGNNSQTDANGNVTVDGVATGSVAFSSNGTTLSAAINSLGVAQISATSFSPGTYTYQASYAGDASFAPSKSAPQTLTITKGITSFTVSPNAITATPVDPPLTLIALLQTDSIAQYPTGKVTATVNGHTYPPSFNNESQGNGAEAIQFTFEIPVSDLAAGSNTINISYGGDANYQASSAGATVTLTGVTGSFSLSGPTQPLVLEASQQGLTTISITPAGGFTGQVNMACTVSAASTGHTPICQASATTVYGSSVATSSVSVAAFADTPVGSYTITVTGTNGQQSQTVQLPLQVTAGPSFTLAAASSSLTIAPPGQSVTNALSITPTQSFTGTVQLVCTITPTPPSGKAPACSLPASVVLGSVASNAMLQVTSDSTTPLGSYSVAVTAFSGVLQQTLTLPLTVQPAPIAPAFGLSAASGAVSIAAPGQSATDLLSITPTGGFTGTVQLSCVVSSSASESPTCSVPATATVTGTSALTATLTLNTTGATGALEPAGKLFGRGAGGVALGCLLLFVVPRRRRWAPLLVLVLTAGLLGVTGCAGSGGSGGGTPGNPGNPGTPAGSYTVTVTAASGSISTTASVVVTVQ